MAKATAEVKKKKRLMKVIGKGKRSAPLIDDWQNMASEKEDEVNPADASPSVKTSSIDGPAEKRSKAKPKHDEGGFLGEAAQLRTPERTIQVETDVMLSDPLHPSVLRMMSSYVATPKSHLDMILKNPLAIALKDSALSRSKKKKEMNTYAQRCVEIVDQDFHLRGALDKSLQQNGILTNQLRKKTDECEKFEAMLAKERARFVIDWSERDKKQIIEEAEGDAKEQRYYSDRKFEAAVEAEKQKFEKRLKEVDKDRLALSRENANLLKQLDSEKTKRIELTKKIHMLEKLCGTRTNSVESQGFS